jgi:hypothetical protein
MWERMQWRRRLELAEESQTEDEVLGRAAFSLGHSPFYLP